MWERSSANSHVQHASGVTSFRVFSVIVLTIYNFKKKNTSEQQVNTLN